MTNLRNSESLLETTRGCFHFSLGKKLGKTKKKGGLMKTIKKSMMLVGMTLLSLPPLQGHLSDAGITDELVLAYAVVLPFIVVLAAIAGIMAASLGDITSYFHGFHTFGWRPGKAHFMGRDRKKKRT